MHPMHRSTLRNRSGTLATHVGAHVGWPQSTAGIPLVRASVVHSSLYMWPWTAWTYQGCASPAVRKLSSWGVEVFMISTCREPKLNIFFCCVSWFDMTAPRCRVFWSQLDMPPMAVSASPYPWLHARMPSALAMCDSCSTPSSITAWVFAERTALTPTLAAAAATPHARRTPQSTQPRSQSASGSRTHCPRRRTRRRTSASLLRCARPRGVLPGAHVATASAQHQRR